MFKKAVVSAALVLGLLGLGSNAQAGLISGGVAFAGFVNLTPGGSGLGTATGFDFVSPGIVLGGSGDYSGVTPGALVTVTDFTFNPFAGPVTPLWTFMSGGDTYSFALTSLAISTQSAAGIVLTGLGVATINGLDATLMNFSISTQANPIGGGYSYSVSTAAVPEPATLGLLGMGLLGLAARARRRRGE